jgi:hypothetical protein
MNPPTYCCHKNPVSLHQTGYENSEGTNSSVSLKFGDWNVYGTFTSRGTTNKSTHTCDVLGSTGDFHGDLTPGFRCTL